MNELIEYIIAEWENGTSLSDISKNVQNRAGGEKTAEAVHCAIERVKAALTSDLDAEKAIIYARVALIYKKSLAEGDLKTALTACGKMWGMVSEVKPAPEIETSYTNHENMGKLLENIDLKGFIN